MKKTNRILSLLLALVLCLGLSAPVMAASGNYEAVNTLSDGLAAAKRDGKWGFIDAAGQEVIPCKYLLISDFHSGVAVVDDGVHDAVINTAGQEIVPAGTILLRSTMTRPAAAPGTTGRRFSSCCMKSRSCARLI